MAGRSPGRVHPWPKCQYSTAQGKCGSIVEAVYVNGSYRSTPAEHGLCGHHAAVVQRELASSTAEVAPVS